MYLKKFETFVYIVELRFKFLQHDLLIEEIEIIFFANPSKILD